MKTRRQVMQMSRWNCSPPSHVPNAGTVNLKQCRLSCARSTISARVVVLCYVPTPVSAAFIAPSVLCHARQFKKHEGWAWANKEYGVYPRATGQCRRPCGSGSLGRRSHCRFKKQLHRDTGQALFTLCHAGQGKEQRYRQCDIGTDQGIEEATGRALQVVDLGQGQRVVQSSSLYPGSVVLMRIPIIY